MVVSGKTAIGRQLSQCCDKLGRAFCGTLPPRVEIKARVGDICGSFEAVAHGGPEDCMHSGIGSHSGHYGVIPKLT